MLELVLKLIGSATQLLTYRQARDEKRLSTDIAPIFAEFERLHAAYKESFLRYRTTIQTSKDLQWLATLKATIETENLFSRDARVKLVRLADIEDDDVLSSFVRELGEYIMDAHLVDPLGKEMQPHRVQRWRQGMNRSLESIASKNWQMVFDPNGAAAPMQPEEIDEALKEASKKYPIDPTIAINDAAIERSCALMMLDEIVSRMQYQYDQVCQAYLGVRKTLSN
jgi:hypothetical protein